MKQSQESEKFERFLRSSKVVAGGFLGDDERPLREIIDSDLSTIQKAGVTLEQLAGRMKQLSEAAKPMLGNPVEVGLLEVRYEDFKGTVVCPWPHAGQFPKAITTVRRRDGVGGIRWSELNMHMIAEHGFFEGSGSVFRVEPERLIEIIFLK